ncbi:MAG: cellulase family glycosylhydrolase [Deltaproteobacteria bacterium]|nr:MAG: cellulase family glycosylhydrolase [Deltaproteobacteria bacterium]
MKKYIIAFTCIAILGMSVIDCGEEKSDQVPVINRIHTDGMWIKDEDGRTLILHGANISNYAKHAPGYISWHTPEDYERMREWGFNAVRLLIFWVALEPSPGSFDEEYLDEVEQRVEWSAANGLYVILDMHQDLYSEKYTGDGAPEWACLDDDLPFEQQTPWNRNYTEPAVKKAFDSFWENRENLQQHFIDSWKLVAERFKDNQTVIGYDLYNEPFFGNLLPEEFEEEHLTPFYEKLITQMQEIDPNHLYFIEPHALTSAGTESYLKKINLTDLGYAVHYYHAGVHEGNDYNLDPTPLEYAADLRESEARYLETPWIMDEFGVNPETVNGLVYLEDLLNILDEKMVGWTYWSYDKGGGFCMLDSEGEEREIMPLLIRPYPQKIAGLLKSYSFDYDDKVFELVFEDDGKASGPTVLFVPADRHYPQGFDVSLSDGTYSFDESTQILEYSSDGTGNEHHLTITPK